MKVAAFSDTHGCLVGGLPKIEKDTDVVCICGDIIPLNYQRDPEMSDFWIIEVFFRWIKEECPAKKVFWIAGNHDHRLEKLGKKKINQMIKYNFLSNKLIYLCDSGRTYKGKKFFGSPWIKDLKNWAFYSPDLYETFKCIPDCDVLLTHIPPQVDKVGCSNPYQPNERDFGSMALTKVLEDKNIKVNLCGHIHTGIHNGIPYGNTTIYNVSMLDEQYIEAYPVTYFEI